MKKRAKNKTRRLSIQPLEKRDLMTRDPFSSVGSLTFSFAPDGTNIGERVSELRAGLDQVAPTAEWQQAFAKAFQTWAVHSNINFGFVSDNGDAAGVYGPTRGDSRFGDVRVSGFDLATDTFAEAVDEGSRAVGSWSGDMFFNTAADWNDVTGIHSAALHEIGHILGLDHSSDPLSPMHTHGSGASLQLTQQDILNLQSLHGLRTPDPHEGSGGNDSIGKAAKIKGSDDDMTTAEGFDGSQVWIQFGDLQTTTDRDVYEIRNALNYTGALSVEVRTRGYSLAKLHAKITDRNGTVLASTEINGDFGGTGLLTLPQTTSEGKYYLHIESGSDPFWSQGDYGITVATPQRLQSDGTAIFNWALNAHRWYYDSDFAENGFSYQLNPAGDDHPTLDDDNHQDDGDTNKATPLSAALIADHRVVYRTVGTISDLTDIDQYRVRAPKTFQGAMEMTIDIESLELNGLVPEAEVLDASGASIASEVRVRGYGQFQLVVTNPTLDATYVIRLHSKASPDFKIGNFTLLVQFADPTEAPRELKSGTLDEANRESTLELYVARPQLFAFALNSIVSQSGLDGSIWLTIFDVNGHRVAGFASPLGEFRSSPGVFLDPGTYSIQIAAGVPVGDLPSVTFHLSSQAPSTPIGPVIGATGVQPKFLCPGETSVYCYPNTTIPTSTPYNPGPPPTTPLPPVTVRPNVVPADGFFWQNTFLPTNPTRPLDVSNDGRLTPLDALIVINYLNANGAGAYPALPNYVGFLDSNADNKITPLDALVVINYLNQFGIG